MIVIRTLFYLVAFLLFIYPLWAAYKTGNRWLNHNSLHRQPVFWIAVMWPTSAFLLLGSEVWFNYVPPTTETGYEKFLEISKLPLGVLASGLAAAAFIASIHRSIQTAKQIEHNDKKQNDDDQKLTKETAAHYLEKAFEILEEEKTFTKNDRAWINASNLLIEYKKIKNQINSQAYKSQLQAEEDYWRAKFEILLSFITFNDLKLLEENKVHASMLFVIAEITTWSTQDPDSTAKSNEDDYFNNFIENLNRNPVMRDFIATREHKIKAHDAYQLISQSREMPSAKQIFEEAVLAVPSDDPAVTEERRRRGLE